MTESAPITASAEEIALTLATLPKVDLDLLAYDISDLLDRGEYGLVAIAQDDLRAGLYAFLLTAVGHAQAQADPHAGAPTTRDGRFIHTCNGDNRSGLPFGKRAPRGECARCDELADGAEPRQRFDGRQTAAQRDAQACREIAAHFASDQHRSGGCGLVCTFGDW